MAPLDDDSARNDMLWVNLHPWRLDSGFRFLLECVKDPKRRADLHKP
jgi:hypothetical protein